MSDPNKKIPILKKKKAPTKRQLQASASKKKIFDTAQALFTVYGYENVTVADICAEAGVSVGLFYNYFNSKSDISNEAFQLIERQFVACAESFKETDSCIDQLMKIARIMLTEICKNDYILQTARIQYTREAQGIPPYAFDRNRTLSALLPEIVHEGQAKGELRNDINEHVIVRIVFTYTIGATIHLLNAPDKNAHIEKSLFDLSLILDGFALH